MKLAEGGGCTVEIFVEQNVWGFAPAEMNSPGGYS
jgi:hypothetical protein